MVVLVVFLRGYGTTVIRVSISVRIEFEAGAAGEMCGSGCPSQKSLLVLSYACPKRVACIYDFVTSQ